MPGQAFDFRFSAFTVLLALLGLPPLDVCGQQEESGGVELTVRAVPAGRLEHFRKSFRKYVNVFGVHVFATAKTPDSKVLHAATILAEYLDNDEDGKPDNSLVVEALASRDAFLMMTASDRELDRIDPEEWQEEGFHCGQFQHADETAPARGRFDASLEEVLHLITQHGYGNAYPRIFGDRKGTELAKCLDKARGGHFTRVPRRYPCAAWFTYDDRSCEYGCQTQEYIYWALPSLLGAQEALERCEEISEEWRLCTPEAVKTRDSDIHALLVNPKYRFPRVLPDGTYREKSGTKKRRGS